MFPAGGALIKMLATVTALLTVATGVPRVQCVCPDGRVKYFCPGPYASGCCCASSSLPGATEDKQATCRTGSAAPACCRHATPEPSARPAGDGRTRAVAPCGCQRTLVADALAYTAETAGDSDRFEPSTVAAWVRHAVAPEQTNRSDRVERQFLLLPSDRVVLFCHFTC